MSRGADLAEHYRIIIDDETLRMATAELTAAFPLLRKIVQTHGAPLLWRRNPGFSSLVYAIIEQQISLSAARAVYERLLDVVDDLNPESFLALDEVQLTRIGFSRRKIEYCRSLSQCVLSGCINLEVLTHAEDDAVRETLLAVRGIGNWTVDIYLIHSLGRSDIWPAGDLALKVAVQESMELTFRPSDAELGDIGSRFRPWRSVAARIFWQGYLSRRGLLEVT